MVHTPGVELERVEEGTRQRLKGIAGTYEIRINRPDGQVRDLRVTATPMRDNDGAYAATLAVFSDVTNQKRADQVLRLSELEREKAKGNELLAQLLQGLAHEIRNPLFAIDVNAAVLEKKVSAVPGVAEHVRFLKEHVARLDSLMRELLELGRKPTEGEMIEVRLRDVVTAAVMGIESQTPELFGRALMEAPETAFTVRAVPDRLQRVFIHIIENALHHSPSGGRVLIRVGRSEGTAFVAVSDEGKGIPEKIRDRLFEPFVTTHAGRRGMGLAFAKHFITAMGGTIEAADNDPGPGATFTVKLPLGG
jgi:signal transduction histidine kinase